MSEGATQTVALTAFLIARIAEDEADWGADYIRNDMSLMGTAERVLAECVAHREIVKMTTEWRHNVCEDPWYTCSAATQEREGEECCDDSRRGGECDCGRDWRVHQLLTALALPYADHPDFRDEWRP